MQHHLDELLQNCTIRPAVNQYKMHPYLQQPDLRKLCQDTGIAVTAWAPIMKGRVQDVSELVAIGEKYGKTAVQVTLRWLLQLNVIAIPKSVSKDRIEASADVYDFEVSEEDMELLHSTEASVWDPHPDKFRG